MYIALHRDLISPSCFVTFSSSGTNRHSLDNVAALSVLCSAGILCTTIQAQDFRDAEGDRLIGRKTLAVVAPAIARITMMPALLTWSFGLSIIWRLHVVPAFALSALAFLVGARFIAYKSAKSDRNTFYLYNVSASIYGALVCYSLNDIQVWLSLAHALPAYFRFVAGHDSVTLSRVMHDF